MIVLNTFLAYLVDGLDQSQARQFLVHILQKASEEKRFRRDDEPYLTLEQTEIARTFQRVVGISLLKVDRGRGDDLDTVRHALLNGSAEANSMLFEFVSLTELRKVELFAHQVSSNGQNVAGMGQSVMAYSGSVKKEMAPLGAEVKLERGTDGQTVDLLIRQQTELHPVKGNAESLLQLMATHRQKEKVRAIIDVAAHFCGVDNLSAAYMICNQLNEQDSAARGVLFFHPRTAQLCWMLRQSPDEWSVLSGPAPEVIQQETGFGPAERFTYYDQDHITGTDIEQMPDAVAVLTGNEDTKLYEMCQGPRRLRGLDRGQRIVIALAQGALPVIASALGVIWEPGQLPNIMQFLLFSCIGEAVARLPENLMLAMQKIDQAIQQHVLDRLVTIDDEVEEEAFFQPVSSLFDKATAVDYYKTYAFARLQMAIGPYLEGYLKDQLARLGGILSPSEIAAIGSYLSQEIFNPEILLGLPSTLDVPPDLQWQRQADRNSQHIQQRLQVQEDQSEKVDERQRLQEQQRIVEAKGDAKRSLFTEQVCSRSEQVYLLRTNGKTFGTEIPKEMPLLPLIQVLLLMGNYRRIAQKPFWTEFERWITTLSDADRRHWAEFFEKHALRDLTSDYLVGKVHNLLQPS